MAMMSERQATPQPGEAGIQATGEQQSVAREAARDRATSEQRSVVPVEVARDHATGKQQRMAREEAARQRRAAERGRRHDPPPAPAPEPLAVPVLDSHTHLDLVATHGAGADPAAQIAAARAVGVDRLVQVGVDLDSSRWAVRLAEQEPAVVATVGVHPNEAPRLADLDEALREVEALAGHPRVRGVGETGLDTFRTGPEGGAVQETSFRAHIAIAKRHRKALIIHDRDAHAQVLKVLDAEGAPETVVMHCFSGDGEFAAECVRRGFLLSFAGTVTFKNAAPLREAVRVCPPEQLLVETDAPYLTPMPHRGRPNAPYLIPWTVRGIAAATEVDLDQLCAAISAAGERTFGPWQP